MIEERTQPISIAEQGRLKEWILALSSRRIVSVRYRNAPGSSWPDGNSAGAIHEVDMDVTLMLDNGQRAVVSWAMAGLVEGLELRIRPGSGTSSALAETDVTASPNWRKLVHRAIEGVAAAWHVPNEGCPDTLWAIRLSLNEGSTITIALGKVEGDVLQYQPDSLVVLFDEVAARAYQPPASAGPAFGQTVQP